MKRLILFLFVAAISMTAMSQATSLVVDNQTPGWLSSKIGYGDQKTVVNLKVTGYIDETDLKFIGSLMQKSLKGRLDLTDVSVVNCKAYDTDTEMHDDYIGNYSGRLMKGNLKHYLIPKTLKQLIYTSYRLNDLLSGLTIDTLTIGGQNAVLFGDQVARGRVADPAVLDNVKIIIICENVKQIWDGDFDVLYKVLQIKSSKKFGLSSIHLPSSLKYIGCRAFDGHSRLRFVNLPDSLEFIGIGAFADDSLFCDTLYLPKQLKSFYIGSFAASGKYTRKDFEYTYGVNYYTYQGYPNVVVFIPKSVNYIADCDTMHYQDGQKRGTDGPYQQREFDICNGYIGMDNVWHIDNSRPPVLKCKHLNLNTLTIYVPKGSVDAYKNAGYGGANILEEPIRVEKVTLNKKDLYLPLDSTYKMEVSISPENADSIGVVWSSRNNSVVNVTENGTISGLKRGKAYVYVESKTYNGIKDSCLVTVYQPVTNIQLNNTEKIIKVGERVNLTTTISPYDADDKSVIWQSENDSIATVDDGKVTGIKAGNVIIKAISVSNQNISANCEVTVLQPVSGITLDEATHTLGNIGESFQLTATISPADASDKEVKWRSTSEGVCIVSAGKVVAVGEGTSVIVAVTNDGSYMATCTVTVDTSVGIHDATTSSETVGFKIYDVDGKELPKLKRGINIIKFQNGETKKVLIP